MHKQAISRRRAAIAAVAVVALSLPLMSVAQAAQQIRAHNVPTALQCRYVGAISHRCYTFHRHATWPQRIPANNQSNGVG